MKRLLTIPILFMAVPLLAEGEYGGFHLGFRGGLAVSPDKSYGSLGTNADSPSGPLNAKMLLAPTVGLHAQYSNVPGRFNVGLLADYIRPVSKGGDPQSDDAASVGQHIIRGELRFGMATRSNEDQGVNFWLSPTYSKIHTSQENFGSLTESKAGGAIGVTGMHFLDRSLAYWEVGGYYVPKTSSGTTAGNFTLELRAGILF